MHSIIYTGDITPPGMRNLQQLLIEARRSDHEAIQVVLSSRGGDVDAGMAAFEFIRMLEFGVHFHAIGKVASIAATLLLAGKTRSASRHAMFCTHAARCAEGPNHGAINPVATGFISTPFRTLLQWADDEIAARFGDADFNFSAEQARKFGCIDTVEDRDFAGGSVVQVHIP